MNTKYSPLPSELIAHMDKQRSFVAQLVAEHFPGERITRTGADFPLLQKIVDAKLIPASETWKLQCLGITFGDAIAQKLGLTWVAVEDEHGRDPALRDEETSIVAFPMTTISKRIERGEAVDVLELFNRIAGDVDRLRTSTTTYAGRRR